MKLRDRLATTIASWPFAAALAVLLANDWWLKAAHPGAVTGKLSDFAGIALVAFLLFAAAPRQRLLVSIAVALAFAWWKSPLSENAIGFVNAFLPWPIARTVDYTDSLALAVLPACGRLASAWCMPSLDRRVLRKLAVAPLAVATLIAIMGTSVKREYQQYVIRRATSGTSLDPEAVYAAVAAVAREHGLEECARPVGTEARGRTYCGNGLVMECRVLPGESASFLVVAPMDDPLFRASGREKAEKLRSSLKSALASRFREVEYVEQLRAEKR